MAIGGKLRHRRLVKFSSKIYQRFLHMILLVSKDYTVLVDTI